jgi:hypothetical protein
MGRGTTTGGRDHAASYRHSKALSYSRLRHARALPTLQRLDGRPRYVGIRRERRNPPSLEMPRLRATLPHLDPAHDTLSGGATV